MSVYIKYQLLSLEPLRIADDSTSQHGQTDSLSYIPGSSIRGYVIHSLSRLGKLEEVKQELFSDKTAFLNAYPTVSDSTKAAIPSPKGFYEEKASAQEKYPIENVIKEKGQVREGLKRATLGQMSIFFESCLKFFHIKKSSDLKIKINDEKRDVFRNEYIMPGVLFEGYIRLQDDTCISLVSSVLEKGREISIGNARSSGFGRCRIILSKAIEELPYQEYISDFPRKDYVYLYLASDTVMRDDYGEYCGLNLETLQKKLGVDHLRSDYSSTSTRIVEGFNRNWGGSVPALPMYEKGSVFLLEYKGEITEQAAIHLMDSGIGVRKNEGFGRILFLKDFEMLQYKEKIYYEASQKTESVTNEDEATLKMVSEKENEETMKSAAPKENEETIKSTAEKENEETTKSAVETEDKDTEKSAGEKENKETMERAAEKEDEVTLRIIAEKYARDQINEKVQRYIVQHTADLDKISASQRGLIDSICVQYRYQPTRAREILDKFFNHANEKEEKQNIQKDIKSKGKLRTFVHGLMDENIDIMDKLEMPASIMEIKVRDLFHSEYKERLRLEIISKAMRYMNKKEV